MSENYFHPETCENIGLFSNLNCGDIYKKLGLLFADINVCLQFFTVFINILHLIVLFQKELRTGAIYILMIGICIADILGYLLDFYNVMIERTWIRWISFYSNIDCLRKDLTYVDVVDFIYIFVFMARPVAVWLAMLMALIRTLSVFFPMSNWIQKLSKPKNAIFMIVVVFTFWTIWHSCQFFAMTLRRYRDVLDKSCYNYEEHLNHTNSVLVVSVYVSNIYVNRKQLETYLQFILTILYPILTVSLLIQLRTIKKKRNNMNKNALNDRSDNTTKLILVMTIFFMTSEGLPGVVSFILERIARASTNTGTMEEVALFLGAAQHFLINIRTLNGISHAFICFAMSSQYRDTVKRMLCITEQQAGQVRKKSFSLEIKLYFQNIFVFSTTSMSLKDKNKKITKPN
ncbi:G-protein coupled receptors family 1 profile domain-containing protein [Caenorhabditis elegans]|uniref:G-protein coupled receptors family 1 profile domain-containing protein n=1 Tax=Caenorhabditis elegans TaxID=6239 RepID=O45778_CAEEL|nr:G-protein coupled receptors family 1 profile domain-containing protein [Caenorhabditis elegans]CAB03337.2 G-protein coupled receptors family 1 profile domain-containing protein [Caenorhabditis elegans]|eukprot:NP_506785.2 Serpentine Receptor, class W [Caenorhabditis elegans]